MSWDKGYTVGGNAPTTESNYEHTYAQAMYQTVESLQNQNFASIRRKAAYTTRLSILSAIRKDAVIKKITSKLNRIKFKKIKMNMI